MATSFITMPVTTDDLPPRTCHERTFTTWDGTQLFYRVWLPQARAETAVVLFHRGHEHSGRFAHLIEAIAPEGVAVFAWDARGHGCSPGERGYADNFAAVIRDVDSFVRFIGAEYEIDASRMVAVGHSVGAVAVAAWVHDYAPPLAGMALVTPAFRVKLYIPFALTALRLRMKLPGRSFIKSYVRAKMLTHDPEQAAEYEKDPLVSRSIATNILIDLHDTSTRLLADAGVIQTPTLLLSSGSDWVVKNSAQQQFFDRLGSPLKEMETYAGMYHALLHEKTRGLPIARIRRFVLERLFTAARTPPPSLLDADQQGHTRREFDELRRTLPPWSPKEVNFALQRLSMKTICRLSEGIRLGWASGFNSGQSLDYVYRNRPAGVTPLGKFIDDVYLKAIGWRGIRQRREHMRELLERTIRRACATGRAVHITDIASGPGRYLLETLRLLKDLPVTATLRDRSPADLDAGRAIAAEMGLTNATFTRGEAFDADALARMQPRPDIAIVSGLYELFPENAAVRTSLRGLSLAVPPGGYLIYTNQPWHPQMEMIARVLTHADGRPWVMRRRSQGEMDELVGEAGFEKIEQRIDPYGIFTVSLARRIAD